MNTRGNLKKLRIIHLFNNKFENPDDMHAHNEMFCPYKRDNEENFCY